MLLFNIIFIGWVKNGLNLTIFEIFPKFTS